MTDPRMSRRRDHDTLERKKLEALRDDGTFASHVRGENNLSRSLERQLEGQRLRGSVHDNNSNPGESGSVALEGNHLAKGGELAMGAGLERRQLTSKSNGAPIKGKASSPGRCVERQHSPLRARKEATAQHAKSRDRELHPTAWAFVPGHVRSL